MKHIDSPCVHICILDNDVCIGCGRTSNEIGHWCAMSDEERNKIMERIKDYGKEQKHSKS